MGKAESDRNTSPKEPINTEIKWRRTRWIN